MGIEEIRAEKKARSIDWYTSTYSSIWWLRSEEDFKRVQRVFESMMRNPFLMVEEREQCLSFFWPQFAEQAEKMAKARKKFSFQPKTYNEMMCIAQPFIVGKC